MIYLILIRKEINLSFIEKYELTAEYPIEGILEYLRDIAAK